MDKGEKRGKGGAPGPINAGLYNNNKNYRALAMGKPKPADAKVA